MASRLSLGMGLIACVILAGCSQEKMEQSVKSAKQSAQSAAQAAGEAKKAATDAAETAKKAAGEAIDAAKEDLATSVAGAADSAAVTKEFSDLFASITQTLTSVKDAASAPTAANQLAETGTKLKGLLEKYNALPAQVKAAVAGVVAKSVESLKPLVDKVMAMPGVGEALKPHIDGIMNQLAQVKA